MLKKIWVKDARNLLETHLSFNQNTPVLVLGENNQGKTNFLESVYFLGNTNSPNTKYLEHLVHFDQATSLFGADVEGQDQSYRIYIKLLKDGQKELTINQKRCRYTSQLKKILNIDYLSADIIQTYTQTGEYRRKDLDGFCGLMNQTYTNTLKAYEKCLKQKNRGLKQQVSKEEIMAFNQTMAPLAAKLISSRLQVLEKLSEKLFELGTDFFTALEVSDVKTKYIFKSLDVTSFDSSQYEALLLSKMNESYHKESAVGYALYGPHKDDYLMLFDTRSLFDFFSRGINRLMSVLIKLSQLKLVESHTGSFPVLLLDDTFAEIDQQHKKRLFDLLIQHSQLIYTSVILDDATLFKGADVYQMKAGKLTHYG